MTTKNDICRKIEAIIPEVGKCNIDFSVEYDKKNQVWAVDLHEGKQHLKTFLEDNDAEDCVGKGKCIPLGLQIGELKRNLHLYRHC